MKFNITSCLILFIFLFTALESISQEKVDKFSISYWESYEMPGTFLHGVLLGNQTYKVGIQYGQQNFLDQFEHVLGADALIRFYTSKKNNGKSFYYGRFGMRYSAISFFDAKFNNLAILNKLGYGINLFERVSLSIDAGIGHTILNQEVTDIYVRVRNYHIENPTGGIICMRNAHLPLVFANASLNLMIRIY